MARGGLDATVERTPEPRNPNVEPLAREHVIAAEVPDHTRVLVLLYDRQRMTTKEQIHQLVEDLPDSDLETVKRVLEGLSALSSANLVKAALEHAPIDDEPVTDEEAQAIDEGERDAEAGRVVAGEEVQIRLGL